MPSIPSEDIPKEGELLQYNEVKISFYFILRGEKRPGPSILSEEIATFKTPGY
jgi:hypothetical protein